jgi:hypothetical protein
MSRRGQDRNVVETLPRLVDRFRAAGLRWGRQGGG